MSIALEVGGSAGFICGIGCAAPIYDSPEIEKNPPLPAKSPYSSSSSSSSIGKDSDDADGVLEDDEGAGLGEVQSAYKGLLQGMETMEESLPIRRGISSFYAGKAKSFTTLSDSFTSVTSAKALAKAANAYTRRRRSLLSSKLFWEKRHSNPLSVPAGGGVAKRPSAAPKRRSRLAFAIAMSGSPRTGDSGGEYGGGSHQVFRPLSPPGESAAVAGDSMDCSSSSQICSFSMRSFSLGDLPVLKNPGSSIGASVER